MRREERHQAKRNDLATLLEEGSAYALQNVRLVAILTVVVLALLIGGLGVRGWLRARETRSARLIGELIDTYNAPITTSLEDLERTQAGAPTFTSTEERDQKVIDLAESILKQGGPTGARPAALLYRGMAQAERRMLDEAEASFDAAVRGDPGGLFAATARLRLARLKESRAKSEEALTLYRAIAEAQGGLLPREEGILGMARCQEALGRKDEALALYRRLISEFPDSEYLSEARSHVEDRS